MNQHTKVLIAEDDPVFRRVLSFSVSRQGFVVECVTNGEEAYQRICQGGIDFLVTDQQMPMCTGLELVQRLRADAEVPHLPIVLCTAKGLELDTIELESRFDLAAVVHKPFSPRKLCQIIEQHASTQRLTCGAIDRD